MHEVQDPVNGSYLEDSTKHYSGQSTKALTMAGQLPTAVVREPGNKSPYPSTQANRSAYYSSSPRKSEIRFTS